MEDYQKFQYQNFKRHWNHVLNHILGKDYCNKDMDVYSCDEFCRREVEHAYDKAVLYGKIFKTIACILLFFNILQLFY